MGILEHLEPNNVFHFFEEISAIPRGSTNTGAISGWCVSFAKARGLEYHQDSFNNVIIIKEVVPGYESAESIILQGYLGTVCGKEPDYTKNMEKEDIDLMIDGDRIRARSTTLSGDDGIAVIMALTVFDSKELSHPRARTVLTVGEEIGMLGTIQLDMSPLKGRRLINLDSGEKRIFTTSCTGGNMTRCRLPITHVPYSDTVLNIMVDGLLNGHSGTDVGKGCANASMLLDRLLYVAEKKSDFHLISIEGGKEDNAIPQQSEALLVATNADLVRVIAADMETAFESGYQENDPGLFVEVKDAATELVPMNRTVARKVLRMLTYMLNDIQEMSAGIEGLVQTSLNPGILATKEEELLAPFCLRNSITTQKQMLVDCLACEMELLGGSIQIFGDYPTWGYRHESALHDLMVRIFQKQYGHGPKISTVHAGLEYGMLMGKLPDLDCISIGPDVSEVHTYRGSMSISSVSRVWDYLIEALQCLKQGGSRKLHGENCELSPRTWVQSRMRICFIQALCQSLE